MCHNPIHVCRSTHAQACACNLCHMLNQHLVAIPDANCGASNITKPIVGAVFFGANGGPSYAARIANPVSLPTTLVWHSASQLRPAVAFGYRGSCDDLLFTATQAVHAVITSVKHEQAPQHFLAFGWVAHIAAKSVLARTQRQPKKIPLQLQSNIQAPTSHYAIAPVKTPPMSRLCVLNKTACTS